MARRHKGRLLNGVLLLDKPMGLSSNDVLQRVRRLYGAAKAGHTGSLDPLATGVLPICFGEATKFSQYLLDADKAYVTTATLGVVTTTSDSEGEILRTNVVPEYSKDFIEDVLNQFRGESQQIPSMFSALKHHGRPLYELARRGVEVEREARSINISSLTLLGSTSDTLLLEVYCSKGTYIRNLVEDIGEVLGCGAHVSMLRRIKAGPFGIDECFTLEQLIDQRAQGGGALIDMNLLPVDVVLADFPKISINSELGRSILHGQPVKIPSGFMPGMGRIYIEGDFVGMGEVDQDDVLAPKRLFSSN